MSYSALLVDLVTDLGGCGRSQWLTAFVGQGAKIGAALSMLHMTFNGQRSNFRCDHPHILLSNATFLFDNACKIENGTGQCDNVVFENSIHTVVDEWDLVCERSWIVAIITTIQMAGVLVGCFISGHLGDLIGRKPTFYLSQLILFVFNIVAYFSVNWQMYAVIRFALGMGIGFFLTVHMNLITEMAPSVWRTRIIAVPTWAIGCSSLALVAWLLKDWRHIHLANAVIVLPFLLTFFFIDESVRWLITKGRYNAANNLINRIARMNKKPKPNTSKLIEVATLHAQSDNSKDTHSVIDLFKERRMGNITLGLIFIWITISFSYYGLTFGVGSLAGNLYMNMFLLNIIETPASFVIMYFVNRFGSKKCLMATIQFTTLCGLAAGIVQYIDTPHRGLVTNVFALASKLGLAVGWGCIITYEVELYPTVVRTIAYGLHNTAARVGGMVAPQIVFLVRKLMNRYLA
ncbi:solute carrier family 22 member 16-like isoform X2 [Dreissena polymorpha]|uniref:solute carrier family 22 member 16-like isoform X2 n=1 Tax=Dreissena polymorpha TaxID=45954 RepID=UPI002264E702|nr:solute carrier family 22 member 16-like isoform X2 [Dreissena polymorpha]